MPSFFYNNDLPELMENFYTLTGIRIVLFDSEFNEILSFPSNEVSFCSLLQKLFHVLQMRTNVIDAA